MKPRVSALMPLLAVASMVGVGCKQEQGEPFTVEVMNRYTPVKDQGESPCCWAYAMLAAIETEHIMRGDSVNLSPAFVEAKLAEHPQAPEGKRATAHTLVTMIGEHGVVPYDAMSSTQVPAPRWAFMLGMQYTVQEFARSVCAPGEYVALTTTPDSPYGTTVVPQWPDNWEKAAYENVHPDTLAAIAERAVRTGHGVCWEGDITEPGFDFKRGVARLQQPIGDTTDDHCMAIVGLARDAEGRPYFVMKNSWGTDNPYGGLMYVSRDYFKAKTLAVVLPRKCVGQQEADKGRENNKKSKQQRQ